MKPPLSVLRAINLARANPTEDTVEGHLLKRCKELSVPCPKLKGMTGWFDRVVFWPGGKPGLVELKRPKKGRWEVGQERMRDKYLDLGYDVQTLYTKTAVDAYVDSKLVASANLRARRITWRR